MKERKENWARRKWKREERRKSWPVRFLLVSFRSFPLPESLGQASVRPVESQEKGLNIDSDGALSSFKGVREGIVDWTQFTFFSQALITLLLFVNAHCIEESIFLWFASADWSLIIYITFAAISLSFPLEIATNWRLEGTTEIREDTGKKSGQIATFILML